ncbi:MULTISPECIES: amidohydrolase family protein [unclassified Streptomyces]|uniref:amidohydrolase family protein n=1 Tax=unclassified Streptomyces TaxID=2593676 RepID=UPI00081E06EA|nr:MULTISPECIES: amidohydrolase family protein [unclassified Streptomyces]PVC82971.1 hydrolase [Streptomyces sp. CS131]SCF69399.1 cytosine deaminase [Streptomyces sp. Cmuel-A718b]
MPDSQPRRPDDNAPDSADAATTADSPALVLGGARLADGRAVDVRLSGSRIEAVGTAGSLTARGARIDLRGYLLLPAPAEPHAHGDTALTADSLGPDSPGPASHRAEDIQRRATEAALLQLGHGATALRTHVRVGDVQGLAPLEAVLQTRRALRGLADVMPVAVPRLLTGIAGADSLAMLRDAVKMGAAVVGGCPDLDPDPTGYTEAVLEIAAEHGLPVDLHTDADDPARLARLAAMAAGLRPGVALGPCAGLAHLPLDAAARAADRLAAAGITVVCLPQGGCAGSERRTTAPVRLLRSAGVRVTAGSGALRDTANPVGRGDPLEAAYLLASQTGLRAEQAYALVSTGARAALGLPDVRVEAGFPAELLAVRGERLSAALSLAYSRIVIHRGRIVARTSAVREYCDSDSDAAAGLGGLPRQGRPDPGAGPRN